MCYRDDGAEEGHRLRCHLGFRAYGEELHGTCSAWNAEHYFVEHPPRCDIPRTARHACADWGTTPCIGDAQHARWQGKLRSYDMGSMNSCNSLLEPLPTLQDTRAAQPDDPNAPRAPLITVDDSMADFDIMTATRIVRIHRAISHQVFRKYTSIRIHTSD